MMDFASSQSPPPGEFLSNVAVMVLIWICGLAIVMRCTEAFATLFWSHDIPITEAIIPSTLPHPNPPGGAVPFDVPLLKATDEQIQAFMSFSGIPAAGVHRYNKNDKEVLQHVANSAAAYKGMLYQERTMKWIDDHFRLKKPGLKYPYVGRHWNGWSSFYSETGPHIRKMFLASVVVIFEHCVNGFVLPGLYLYTRDDTYYNLALYGETAYMIYATTLIGASYKLKRDVTIEQMHESVWPLLVAHHVASMALCVLCIFLGGTVPKDLVCSVLLALVGLTSSLHYVGQILDFCPLAQANRPYTRLCNHIFCLASQIVFRVLYWMRLFHWAVIHCFEAYGVGIALMVASILLLFTLFNVDFVNYHLKATKGCWTKIQQQKLGKCS